MLDNSGTPYMVVGSVASSLHGTPRSTLDVDLVADPSSASLEALVQALLDAGYYVEPDTARSALRDRTQFNAIDPSSGWKADFVMLVDAPFEASEFRRRRTVKALGTDIYMATPEDTIIAKLRWAQAGESERQLRDVAGILQVSGPELDATYIDRWIRRLDLQDVWAQANAMAEWVG